MVNIEIRLIIFFAAKEQLLSRFTVDKERDVTGMGCGVKGELLLKTGESRASE